MDAQDPRRRDDANGTENPDSTDTADDDPTECNETVDPETRQEVLAEYQHRCQACGQRDPEQGGLATLHVHHIERDPDGMDEHDLENLTLLCRPCHAWVHQRSTPADSPVAITEADQSVPLPQDIQILRYLAEHGPTHTGDIASGLPTDLSVSAIRERLWVLMGLDNLVEPRDEQVVDKDVETGQWGLVEQIETSARGHIPDDPHRLLQRMEDEQVRQALERGCDRSAVIEVLDVSRRTTFNKQKRACAYDFPLDAVTRRGKGAPPGSGHAGQPSTGTEALNEAGDQRRLDTMVGHATDTTEQSEADTVPEATADDDVDGTAMTGDAGDKQGGDGCGAVHAVLEIPPCSIRLRRRSRYGQCTLPRIQRRS